MCGRYTARRIDFRRYGLDFPPPWYEEFSERTNLYNIAPSLDLPIIRYDSQGKIKATRARWGLIPHWTKGKPKLQPINARCETAATSPMFKGSLERQRCLVPADGFYEWQGKKSPKQPYFIHRKDDEPFAFAGLWERWKPDAEAEPVETFTLITTTPNELMKPIHDRMPVILDAKDYQRWIDGNLPASAVADLLKPYPAEVIEAYRVSTKVNKPGHQGAELIEAAKD